MVSIQIDPRRPRESINQVNHFLESTIYYGTLFDEQSLRIVHGILPNLCKLIFGADCPGTSRFDYEKGHPILEFLSPTGPLCTFLLAHFSNRQWVYTILEEHLPIATSDALKSGELTALPDMYQGRVVDATLLPSTNSTGSLSSSLSSTSTSSLITTSLPFGSSERFIVTFNMFEYFFFYFSYSLTHPPFPSPPSRRDWYPFLVRMYLDFFVPFLSTRVVEQPAPSSTKYRSVAPMKDTMDRSIQLFTTCKLPPGTVLTPLDRLTCSKYVIGCLIENWLSPTLKREESGVVLSPTVSLFPSISDFHYTPLSLEALQCISILAEHVSSCDLLYTLDTPLPNLEFRLTSYSNSLSSEKLGQIALNCLPKLISLFKTAIRHHPLDSSFFTLIQAWILWLTPHQRRCSPSMTLSLSKALGFFVHQNLILYIEGFYSFLEKASTLDYMDPNSIRLLEQVLQLYLDERIHVYLSNEVRSRSLVHQVGAMYVDFLGYLPSGMMEHIQTILHKLQLVQQHELSHLLAQLFDLATVPLSSHSPSFSSTTTTTTATAAAAAAATTGASSTSPLPPSVHPMAATVAPPISVFDVEMTQDHHLTLTGRFQVKHGLKKSPPLPRMRPGFQRDVIFSTEIPWLVSWTYFLSDLAEQRWHVRLNLRWLAERNCLAWFIILLNVYFGIHFKAMVFSVILILLIYFVA